MSTTMKSPSATARIRAKNQVTLPQAVCDTLQVAEGEFLTFSMVTHTSTMKVEAGTLIVSPQRLAPHLWSEEDWRKKEEEADADIAAGRVHGPFKTPKQALRAMKKDLSTKKKRKR